MGLNLKGLMLLSFLAATGFTLVILGCALAHYNWWPAFVIIFYILAPLPIVIAKRFSTDSYMGFNYSGRGFELAVFLTSIFIVSAYALPIVLARAPLDKPIIRWGSAGFIFGGNTVIFITIAECMKHILNDDGGF